MFIFVLSAGKPFGIEVNLVLLFYKVNKFLFNSNFSLEILKCFSSVLKFLPAVLVLANH